MNYDEIKQHLEASPIDTITNKVIVKQTESIDEGIKKLQQAIAQPFNHMKDIKPQHLANDVRIIKMDDNQHQKWIHNHPHVQTVQQEFANACASLGINSHYLYEDTNPVYPMFHYYDSETHTYHRITSLPTEFIIDCILNWYRGLEQTKGNIHEYADTIIAYFVRQINNRKQAYQEGDHEAYLSTFERQFKLRAFTHNLEFMKQLSNADYTMAFIDAYINAEYHFDDIDWDDVLDKPFPNNLSIMIPTEYIDEQGYVTVYRGFTEKSTPLEYAKSWTLNKDIAHKFATRMHHTSHEMNIATGRIHVNNIILFIKSAETEILAHVEDIEDIHIEAVDAP